jgi:hypothetical protein
MDGRVYILKEPRDRLTAIAVIGDAKQFILELQVDEYDITQWCKDNRFVPWTAIKVKFSQGDPDLPDHE